MMRPWLVATTLAVLVAGAFVLGRGSHGPTAPVAPGGDAFARLEASLAAERSARELLEAEVVRLAAELEMLRLPTPELVPGRAGAEGDPLAEASDSEARPDATGEVADVSTKGWFDETSLVRAGLRPADAAALRELYEEIEMERLYLRDTAIREGWDGRRLQAEQLALDARMQSVADEWGDDVYDWFLYAAGRTNRVVIESVLGGSPAAEAGVQVGDEVLSYAGQRVFTPRALRLGTNLGALGETVVLEVSRNGQTERISLPRGPLGVRLDTIAAAPRPL